MHSFLFVLFCLGGEMFKTSGIGGGAKTENKENKNILEIIYFQFGE